MERDLLGVLEAAYREGSEAEWRQGLLDAARPLDQGLGVLFLRTVTKPGGFLATYDEHFGTTRPDCLPFFLETVRDMTEDQVRRMMQASGITGSMILGPEAMRAMATVAPPDLGILDCIGIQAPVSRGVTFGAYILLGRVTTLDRRTIRRHRLLGAHLAAARRLRERNATVEAVLEPSGRVAHAEPAAVAAREALVRRVREIESARTRRGRADIDGALSLWKGLVDGEWSLVEHFESDGRRFLVARRNAPHLGAVLRLSPLQARVVRLAAVGLSQKYIAYTLGLGASAVHEALALARMKLGVRTQGELLATYGRLAAAADEAEATPAATTASVQDTPSEVQARADYPKG